MKVIRGLEHLSCEDGLREMEKRKFLKDFAAFFQCVKGTCVRAGEGLATRACNDAGNGFKAAEGRLRLDIRKRFFTVVLLRHCNRMSRDTVDSPIPGSVHSQAGRGWQGGL